MTAQDPVEQYLIALLDKTDPNYKGIAETALGVYNHTGGLTEKLHTWAIKAGKVLKVERPQEFASSNVSPSPRDPVSLSPLAAVQPTPVPLNNAVVAHHLQVIAHHFQELAKALGH